MVKHSYECQKCNHQFDKIVEWDRRYAKCPECGKRAERSWQQRKVRRFSEPVVLHKYADGSYGVPGHCSATTPPDAERIECWNMADYERALGKMNQAERATASRKHEAAEALRAERIGALREEIKYRMAQAGSEWERDMLALTLERSDGSYRKLEFREFRNELLEYDSINRG